MTLFFVTVQARAYYEALHLPGVDEKYGGLLCKIETQF